MRTNQLKFLIALQHTDSINKASKAMYTTPQNISKAIKQLENEWGVPLVDCSQQGTVLTPAGEEAAIMAQGMLSAIDQFVLKHKSLASTKKTDEEIKGAITIVFSRMSSVVFLGELVLQFNTKYPQIKITTLEHDSGQVLDLVSSQPDYIGVAPCIILPNPSPDFLKYQDLCDISPLVDDEMVVLISKKSTLAKQKNISFQKLSKLKLAMYSHGDSSQCFGMQFISSYNASDIQFSTSNSTLYYQGAANGNYAGFSSLKSYANLDESLRNNIQALPIRETSHFNHCLILNPKISPDDKCKHYFIKFLQQHAPLY